MFCPRCGAAMNQGASGFTCAAGEMSLSKKMNRGLLEVFVERTRQGTRHPESSLRLGGPWFCPGCGVAMTVEGCHASCPKCGGVLDEFIHGLVELHPHASV